MTIINPEATSVQGYTTLQVVLDIADPEAPSLAGEINDATSLNVSLFVRDWNPELQVNTGNAPPRVGTTVQLPVEGNTQFNPIELRYIYDPQGSPSSDDNKLKALLVRGTEFYMVVRYGLDMESVAWAAGQRVEVWRCRAGKQNSGRSGTDEFAEREIVQNIFPLADKVEGVIAA